MSPSSSSSWIVCPEPRPLAQWRLVCFPYGGGGPQAFRGWVDKLPVEVELLALSLPGRGSRLRDPLISDMATLVKNIAAALHPYFDKPMVFFGHSVGALVAYEVVRHFRDASLPLPLQLVVSAHVAPHQTGAQTQMYRLADDELIEVVRRLGLVPSQALDNPELRELILPPLRADFELSETYESTSCPALAAPIVAMGGRDDDLVQETDLAAWAGYTSAAFHLHIFAGDHFYTEPRADEVVRVMLERVRGQLQAGPKSIIVGPAADYPLDTCLHELFRAQAAATPDATAVVDGERHLSFRELDAQTDLLAGYLQGQGVGVDRLVGLYLDTSLEFVLGYVAALKAGGAALPLEVTYPAALLADTIAAAEPVVVLTTDRYLGDLPGDWASSRRVCSLSPGWMDRVATLGAARRPRVSEQDPDTLAYCVLSSGTTGAPKGILCPHRGAVNSYSWRYQHYPYTDGEREACNVFFVWEFLRPMLRGYPLHIIPDDVIFDPPRLIDYLCESRITRTLLTPSLLDQVLSTPGLDLARKLESLQVVYLNGEVVTTALQQRFAARLPDVTLLNDYSISECHDVCTTDLGDLNPVLSPSYAPLGTPMANVGVYVLDAMGDPVPHGLPGEVYVSGSSLARGYLNAPQETAQRFLPDTIRADGSRMFRTGDTGRIRPDGQLEIHGRAAFMVKIRGYSIVPGAVESTMLEHPGVKGAVVVTADDEHTGQPEHLVGYVVGDGQVDDQELIHGVRSHLKDHLPHYAVPSYLIPLTELPLSGTGKLDRRRLPDPSTARTRLAASQPGTAPVTSLERVIAELWRELLGVDVVAVTDNFFDLGGHSLLAARLCSRLREDHGLRVSVIDVFQHPTVRRLAESLQPEAPRSRATARHRPARSHWEPSARADIAIVGVACRFPGAPDVNAFWRNLRDGVGSVRELSEEELRQRGIPEEVFRDADYRKHGAVLDGVDLFDAAFWGISAKEATLMDPQHRLFLECSWQALEDAGYAPRQRGARTGVFGGCFLPSYLLHYLRGGALLDPRDPMEQHLTEIGNDKDYLTTRVSHLLNLRGPSVNVQTSCSTSLVAVATACQSLLAQQCDMALAGAASITFPQAGYQFVEGHINSSDGQCRPFDAEASGTILGDGVGVVVLKRLPDAQAARDSILAVITGFAVNNDGNLKAGYSAPSVQGQAEVVAAAQQMAGVTPDTISYLECHGTGTLIGDPIEMRALSQVFTQSTRRRGFCAVGSVKANIGHSNIAAGMAGLIKTVLALRHRQLPPLVNFRRPNPELNLHASPFYINDTLQPWAPADDHPRRAGVSCFGIGGTNSHIVLEEHRGGVAGSAGSAAAAHLITVSANTPESLERSRHQLIGHLAEHPDLDLGDVAYTLHVGRESFPHRLAVAGSDSATIRSALARATPARVDVTGRGIVFMFPGQGSQYLRMGYGLYEHLPVFRRHYDECADLLAPRLGADLRRIAFARDDAASAGEAFGGACQLQSALFTVEYALARTLMAWGLQPSALVGHSLGEYVAACLAGVFSLEDALALVVARASAMQDAGPGAMLSVQLPVPDAHAVVADEPELDVAVINSPTDVVLAGSCGAIERVARRLDQRGVASSPVHVTRAFHSPMMAGAAAAVEAQANQIALRPPTIPMVSNVTGEWFADADATDPAYWGRQVRQTVRFADNVQTLLRREPDVMLEVGPGRTLTNLVAKIKTDSGTAAQIMPCLRHPQERRAGDSQFLAQTVARLWASGVHVDWEAYHADEQRRRVPLPGYSFEGKRCWPDAIDSTPWLGPSGGRAAQTRPEHKLPLADWFSYPSWRRALPTHHSAVPQLTGAATRWLVYADEVGPAAAVGEGLIAALEQRGDVVVRAYRSRSTGPAIRFVAEQSGRGLSVRLAAGYDQQVALFEHLAEHGQYPDRIVYLWSLDHQLDQQPGHSPFDAYHDLLGLAKALTVHGHADPVRLWVVAEQTVQVNDEPVAPEKAILRGPCLVVAQENPQLSCQLLDLQLGSVTAPAAREDVLRQILGECAAPQPDAEALVALRGRHRWVPRHEPLAELGGSRARRLRPGGVYLVTGGLGRIGMVLARHLSALPAKIVLTSRSFSHPPEQWAQLAQSADLTPKDRQVLRGLLAIEAAGSEVVVLSGDVSVPDEADQIVAATVARFGRIDGVFHAAGLADLTYLPQLTEEIVARELAPKVHGLRNLEQALGRVPRRQRQGGFVMLFSSIAAELGGLAMAAYSSANQFMDAFVLDNPRRHGMDWTTINWDDWDFEYGKEQVAAYTKTQVQYAMSSTEGLAALELILDAGISPQVVVSTRLLQSRIDQWVRLDAPRNQSAQDGNAAGPTVEVGCETDAPDGLAAQVTAVYRRVLGAPQIGLDDDFFDLGGDSLLATQIVTQLRRAVSVQKPIQVRDVFDYPTVRDVTQHLAGQS